MKRVTTLSMRPLYLGVFCVLIIGLVGCDPGQSSTRSELPALVQVTPVVAIATAPLDAAMMATPLADTDDRVVSPVSAGSDEQRQQAQQRRLIIKNGELSMIVADPKTSVDRITGWVEEKGGWVVGSNLVAYDNYQQAVMTVRIPAPELNNAIAAIKREATKLLSEAVTGADVTAEYADAQSQLTNLEAAETQLRSIMEKATTIEEILSVYNQLTSIRGQIEQIKGRMQLLEQSSAFSSIKVTLQMEQPPTPTPTITPTPEYRGWQLDKVAGDAGSALVSVLQFLISVVVWSVIVVLPTAILVGVPSYLVYRIVNRRKPINKVEGENS